VVVYFYPAAFTSGCTIEAHDFAEAMPQYQALGASVIGVSHDDMATLGKFSVSECQSKFPVASDSSRTIMKSYDATMGFLTPYADRVSYVIAQNGKIAFTYSAMDPDEHVSRTLKAVAALKAR
jgi:peroxiredoxin